MTDQRLIHVVGSVELEDEFEPRAFITVTLLNAPVKDQKRALERIIDGWGILGGFGAMPHPEIASDLVNFLPSYNEIEGRRELYRSAGTFKAFIVSYPNERAIECYVAWGGMSPNWLDVLLNCLEGYHVQVAPIERVQLRRNEDPNED